MQSLAYVIVEKSAETILLGSSPLGDLTTSRTQKVGNISKSFLINSSNKTLSFPLNLPTHTHDSREIGVAIARTKISTLSNSSPCFFPHTTVVEKFLVSSNEKIRFSNKNFEISA